VGFRFSENIGKVAENIVFLALKRKQATNPYLELYYWKDVHHHEVDFVVKEGLKIDSLIQVCWELNRLETKNRQVKVLIKAMDEFKLKEGLIITEEHEGKEKIKDKEIIYIPLWK